MHASRVEPLPEIVRVHMLCLYSHNGLTFTFVLSATGIRAQAALLGRVSDEDGRTI